MDYQQIVCQATGKSIRAEKMYKIRNYENCVENVISICHSCPFANCKHAECNNCYGSIVQNSSRQVNENTGRVKMQSTNYRNTFIEIDGEYYDMMEADEFLQMVDDNQMIIANLNNSNWNHGQRISDHLRGYDRPMTWKTDCINCKQRCKNQGRTPACEKAHSFMIENGVNPDSATSEQLAKIILPNDCICQEQCQRMYYV